MIWLLISFIFSNFVKYFLILYRHSTLCLLWVLFAQVEYEKLYELHAPPSLDLVGQEATASWLSSIIYFALTLLWPAPPTLTPITSKQKLLGWKRVTWRPEESINSAATQTQHQPKRRMLTLWGWFSLVPGLINQNRHLGILYFLLNPTPFKILIFIL